MSSTSAYFPTGTVTRTAALPPPAWLACPFLKKPTKDSRFAPNPRGSKDPLATSISFRDKISCAASEDGHIGLGASYSSETCVDSYRSRFSDGVASWPRIALNLMTGNIVMMIKHERLPEMFRFLLPLCRATFVPFISINLKTWWEVALGTGNWPTSSDDDKTINKEARIHWQGSQKNHHQ